MQLTEMIPRDANILEVGSGNGELLYLSSRKVRYGMGLEQSGSLVRLARKRLKSEGIRNIAVRKARFPRSILSVAPVDCGIAATFFSKMNLDEADSTLTAMANICSQVLIADYSDYMGRPGLTGVLSGKDSRQSANFKSFAEAGFVEGLIERTGLEVVDEVDSLVKPIKLYRVVSPERVAELPGQSLGLILS